MKRFILLFVLLFSTLSIAQMNMAEVAARIKRLETNPTISTSTTFSFLTASQLVGTNASKQLVSLAVATYPSLAELAYVKGVTSAIQTQIGTKQSTLTNSAGLLAALSDETGTGLAVFSSGPVFTGTATVASLRLFSAVIDSAKVSVDTLFFYVGGSRYKAIKGL